MSDDFVSVLHDHIFIRNCPDETSTEMTLGRLNDALDELATLEFDEKHNVLRDIMRMTCPSDMVWVMRIMLKKLNVGLTTDLVMNVRSIDCAVVGKTDDSEYLIAVRAERTLVDHMNDDDDDDEHRNKLTTLCDPVCLPDLDGVERQRLDDSLDGGQKQRAMPRYMNSSEPLADAKTVWWMADRVRLTVVQVTGRIVAGKKRPVCLENPLFACIRDISPSDIHSMQVLKHMIKRKTGTKSDWKTASGWSKPLQSNEEELVFDVDSDTFRERERMVT